MNIVVADDHAMTRSGVVTALYVMFPAATIIECVDAVEVLAAAKSKSLTLAVVDLFMPGSDGFSFLKKLCNTHPELSVVVLSASDDAQHVRRALDLGVSGFIHKSSGFDLMHSAIKKVMSGGIYTPDIPQLPIDLLVTDSDFTQPEVRVSVLSKLTKRQVDVLSCLAQGLSNKAIAERLCVSENTVKTHLKKLMIDLDCRNRTEAGVLAEKLGLVSR